MWKEVYLPQKLGVCKAQYGCLNTRLLLKISRYINSKHLIFQTPPQLPVTMAQHLEN